MHDRDWPIAYDFIAIQAPGPYCMGVGSKDSVPAGFPKKDSGLAPEGLSIRTGTGAGHRPLWCPTMALKIKIPGGPGGLPLALLFPLSLCKEGGRRPDPFLQGVLEFVRTYKTLS